MAEKGFTFTPEILSKSFQTYREQLIVMPMMAMDEALRHMNIRTGIRYRETVSQLGGKFQMGNYKKDKKGDGNFSIEGRIFETFFGNIIEPIDPNSIRESIWGSNITKGEELKKVPIVLQVCAYLMKQIGENLFMNLFTAKHDGTNFTETAKFFNGFKSIIDADIAGTNSDGKVKISADIGNLKKSNIAMAKENAEDLVKEFFWSRDARLRAQKSKLFMSDLTYHLYTESYQLNHGSLPYNQSYDKRTLEGASNVEIVPLACVPENFMVLTPKNNINVLFNQKSDDEKYLCEKSLDNHYDVDFIANMFFGTQFESVSKEVFSVWMKGE